MTKQAVTRTVLLEQALRARIERRLPRRSGVHADIVFDAGSSGTWTVRLRGERTTLREGRARRPAATLSADPETMLAVIEGRTVGIEAFLQGTLSFRGNIALALELDDLLHPVARSPRAPRVKRVDVAGVQTYVLEAGPLDAPPVVVLHGLGATSASFLPTIWELSKDYRVIAPDLPGFGETDKPLRPLRPEFFARHVTALLDALGIRRAHLIGNSLGGRIALEVALRAPERVDKVALLAPSMAWLRFRFAARLVGLVRHEVAFLPLPVLHWGVVRVLRSMFAVPDRVPVKAMYAAADEFQRVFSTARGRVAFFNAMREIYLEEPHGHRGFWHHLPTLSRPALFVFGDRDWLVPRGFAKFVAQAAPSARCEIIEGCGHVPQFELPHLTHALVRAFFAEATT